MAFRVDVQLRLQTAARQGEVRAARDELARAYRAEVARVGRSRAPVVSGRYQRGIIATDQGVVATEEYSADVERRHRVLHGAADEVASRLDALVRPL